jgi:septum formation protein
VPENLANEEIPEFLAVQKAIYISKKYPERIVIAADTVVIINDEILGKPKDKADAKRMLKLLSGKTHTVITGVAVWGKTTSSFSEISKCTFYQLTEKKIDEYISTGEPMDKAGAYGIQGKGALLVKSINGDFYNIMGLPIARLSRFL